MRPNLPRLLAAVLFAAPAVHAAPGASPSPPPPVSNDLAIRPASIDSGSRREEIQAKLRNLKITLEFNDTPLQDAIDFIRSFSGIDFVIDAKVRDRFQADTLKVNLKVRQLPLRSALKLMLDEKNLGAVYRDGVVVIVLKEEMDKQVTLRLYDVRDLLMKIQDFPGPTIDLKPPGQGAHGANAQNPQFIIEETKPVLTEEFIVDLVKKTCSPDAWQNPNTSVTLNNGLLMVVQSKRVHDEIQQLIGMLRQYR